MNTLRPLICCLAVMVLTVTASAQSQLKLVVRDSFLPSIPVLVRVELRTAEGEFDRSAWDTEVELTTTDPGVSITPDRITLRNGCGSALVDLSAAGGLPDIGLTGPGFAYSSPKILSNLTGTAVTTVSGELQGTETTWSGVVRLTGDTTVPEGHTLTVEAGTLVLIDGVASGRTAPDLFVRGRILSLGTEEAPVTFTCSDASLRWGQIDHDGAEDSLYRYTVISRGGRAQGEGHTGQGPAIDVAGSSLTFENCTIADHAEVSPQVSGWGTPGKIMQANGSDLVFDECLLTRARMGPEISGTAILFRNSYIIDMRGDDDADAIYIHGQGAGQRALIEGSVVAGTDDDGIDTLGSRVTVHDTIVRDMLDKGMSIFGNEVNVSHCLSANCGIGLSSKASGSSTVTTRIWNSTIVGKGRGIAAENKNGGAPNATVLYFVTNSIMQATERPDRAVYTDYDISNIVIEYSTTISTNWAGVGNLTSDPQFVDVLRDYRLKPGSPCIDAGDPASALDPDGTRTDMGVYPFLKVPPLLADPVLLPGGIFEFDVLGGDGEIYDIEASEGFSEWQSVLRITNSGGTARARVPVAGFRLRHMRAVKVPPQP